jgi:hypothetical protein
LGSRRRSLISVGHLVNLNLLYSVKQLTQNRCHGPAIFPGVIDPTTGKSIINGKTITGFGLAGEEVMGLTATLRSWGKPLVDDIAEELGAKCMCIVFYFALFFSGYMTVGN